MLIEKRSARSIQIPLLRQEFEREGKCPVCAHRHRVDPAGVREVDPESSYLGLQDVVFRRGSQKHQLLLAYANLDKAMNSDEARRAVGLSERACYWKRVSELVQGGYLVWTGQMRSGDKGSEQNVYRITDKGLNKLDELDTGVV